MAKIIPKIFYVSAPCGAGKTMAAAKFIQNGNPRNFVYVAPTTSLVSEMKQALNKIGVTCTAITSATHPSGVKSAIHRHLKDTSADVHDVLLITWEGLSGLRFFPAHNRPQIIIDEVPQLDAPHELHLPVNSYLIHDHVTLFTALQKGRLVAVRPKNAKRTENLLAKKDDGIEPFRKFFNDLTSPHKTTFLDINSWHNFNSKSSSGDRTLYFVSLHNSSLFENAILLGANIEYSLLYNWLPRFQGAQFVPHEEIIALLATPIDFGRKLKIRYFLENRISSKSLHNTAIDGRRVIDLMNDVVLQEFREKKFLHVPNVGEEYRLDGCCNAFKISPSCRGLNAYQDYENVYYSAALNRTPKHSAMMSDLGFTYDDFIQSTAGENAYQVIMRTALRNPAFNGTVTAIVGDETVARHLAKLTGCNDIKKIGDIELPQKAKALTSTQKDQRSKAKEALGALLANAENIGPNTPIREDGTDSEAQGTFGGQTPACRLTFHRRVTDNRADQFTVKTIPLRALVKAFRKLAFAPIEKKEDQLLFNMATFNDCNVSFRTQASFSSSSGMVLDFDNGDLSPEKFKDIFWHEVKGPLKKSFIICNSFSRSPEQPNKFRVIFPYGKQAKSIREHQAVFDQIVQQLEVAGFTQASAKLDPACRSGVQSFYLPCKNRKHPEWAFFESLGLDQRGFSRHAVNPHFIAKLTPNLGEVQSAPTQNGAPTTEQIKGIVAKLLSMTEGRHAEVHKVIWQLKARGLTDTEVRTHLPFGTEEHMRKKVRDSLRSYKYARGRTRSVISRSKLSSS